MGLRPIQKYNISEFWHFVAIFCKLTLPDLAIQRWIMLKFDLKTTKIKSVGVTIDDIDIQKIGKTVTKSWKSLHSLRQDIWRPVLTIGWHVSLETENWNLRHWDSQKEVSRLLGIEAGKFLGVWRIFVQFYSNLPE